MMNYENSDLGLVIDGQDIFLPRAKSKRNATKLVSHGNSCLFSFRELRGNLFSTEILCHIQHLRLEDFLVQKLIYSAQNRVVLLVVHR